MEDDVEKVLVSPRNVVLVLLIEWMQKILPRQAAGDHAVLWHKHKQLSGRRKWSKEGNIYIPVCSGEPAAREAAKLSSEGRSLWCWSANLEGFNHSHFTALSLWTGAQRNTLEKAERQAAVKLQSRGSRGLVMVKRNVLSSQKQKKSSIFSKKQLCWLGLHNMRKAHDVRY